MWEPAGGGTQWGDHAEFLRISHAVTAYLAAKLLLEADVFLLVNPHQVTTFPTFSLKIEAFDFPDLG